MHVITFPELIALEKKPKGKWKRIVVVLRSAGIFYRESYSVLLWVLYFLGKVLPKRFIYFLWGLFENGEVIYAQIVYRMYLIRYIIQLELEESLGGNVKTVRAGVLNFGICYNDETPTWFLTAIFNKLFVFANLHHNLLAAGNYILN